jgi:type III restriction enzyme
MEFLYKKLDLLEEMSHIPEVVFSEIEDNLSTKFPIRDYQNRCFVRFDYILKNSQITKQVKPYHLLFNMATGSGKTLIMAGLILYLYQKGIRNFLFFVHNNNILEKTKDNFLNKSSSKYLFKNEIVIGGKRVFVKQVNNFDNSDNENINIHFTSIQKLHNDLTKTEKENSISLEDFKERKIALLGDEAHHYNANSKSQMELFKSWEQLIIDLHKSNDENILLEFTATHDFKNPELTRKYHDKVIIRYDLSQFRIDKYSKEINLIRSLQEESGRILQALLLNLYRQELATAHGINLKPVILFKAKSKIEESRQNKIRFHKLIDDLSPKVIDSLRNSPLPVIKKAFSYFDQKGLSSFEIVDLLKTNFKFENCLSANESNKEKLSIEDIESDNLLNTLENENNPIRAIFAVQKLNEGWDVLNLFDIVRLYETRDGKGGKVGATTLSEAQLIGRGARYFPFVAQADEDRFKRKYDDDLDNDLKILEELYYHTKEDSRYISELRKALEEQGSLDPNSENLVIKELKIKEEFKQTSFYQTGRVAFNKKEVRSFENVKSFQDLGVSRHNHPHKLSSNFSKSSSAFFELEKVYEEENQISRDIDICEIPIHIIQYAISKIPFFEFNNLLTRFPNLTSTTQFINSRDYLSGLTITFTGPKSKLVDISNEDYLQAIIGLLTSIEHDIKSSQTTYKGSAFITKYIHEIFVDKKIQVYKDDPRADGQLELVEDVPWYVYNANYGTEEEKAFVKLFARKFDQLNKKFGQIFLVRNERVLKIIDKLGRAFEPDFILFCEQNQDEELTYQVFIEPKGAHLLGEENMWKEDFLNEMAQDRMLININTEKCVVTGVPFYKKDFENEFGLSLFQVLNIN